MTKELWVVGSSLNPLIVADRDWEIMALYIRNTLGMIVTDNKAEHDSQVALFKGENK